MRLRPVATKREYLEPINPLERERRRALSTSQRALAACERLLQLIPETPRNAKRRPGDQYEVRDAALLIFGLLGENVTATQRVASEVAIIVSSGNALPRQRDATEA